MVQMDGSTWITYVAFMTAGTFATQDYNFYVDI